MKTFNCKQSSETFLFGINHASFPNRYCMQDGPNCVARRVPFHPECGCGRLNRRSARGGAAYGMPRYCVTITPLYVTFLPTTLPPVVGTMAPLVAMRHKKANLKKEKKPLYVYAGKWHLRGSYTDLSKNNGSLVATLWLIVMLTI